MDNELLVVRDMAMAAQKTADKAADGISSHEAVCAERYTNIKDRLTGIPRLFEIIEKGKKETAVAIKETEDAVDDLRKWVYIGIGICTTVPIIIAVLQAFREH